MTGGPQPAVARAVSTIGMGGSGGMRSGDVVGARTLALGQDAGGLPAEAGLTHAAFRAGDVVRTPVYPPAHTLPSQ
jgi:hypothetical protein